MSNADLDEASSDFDPSASSRDNPLLGLPAAADNAVMPTEPPKAEPPKHKRRWFQFSLRSLMIGVTLLAVASAYVGWQARIVRERLELLKTGGGSPVSMIGRDQSKDGQIPFFRRLMGDRFCTVIWLDQGADIGRYKTAFPEADVGDDKSPPALPWDPPKH